jgi:hypothetical protein
MKRLLLILMMAGFWAVKSPVMAQCSICTKTAQQMGHKPAQGLNTGILYLMFAPFVIVGFVGYRWWKNNK